MAFLGMTPAQIIGIPIEVGVSKVVATALKVYVPSAGGTFNELAMNIGRYAISYYVSGFVRDKLVSDTEEAIDAVKELLEVLKETEKAEDAY